MFLDGVSIHFIEELPLIELFNLISLGECAGQLLIPPGTLD